VRSEFVPTNARRITGPLRELASARETRITPSSHPTPDTRFRRRLGKTPIDKWRLRSLRFFTFENSAIPKSLPTLGLLFLP
jgi:hypothetical protein